MDDGEKLTKAIFFVIKGFALLFIIKGILMAIGYKGYVPLADEVFGFVTYVCSGVWAGRPLTVGF